MDNAPGSDFTTQPQSHFSNTTVGYVYDSRMMMHTCVRGHSEAPERISRIFDSLKTAGCLRYMVQIPIREVNKGEVLLVHSESLWNKVAAISCKFLLTYFQRRYVLNEVTAMSDADIVDSEAYYEDLSLYVHPSTPLAARLSCGGVIEAALAVARGSMKKSFAIVRPPGHHAEPDEHMGFCFFNNVAIATKVVQLLTPLKKILILDWFVFITLQCTPLLTMYSTGMCTMVSEIPQACSTLLALTKAIGNGTQHAFYNDPSVLYISLHRYDGGQFYPNGPFGSMTSCGEGPGLG